MNLTRAAILILSTILSGTTAVADGPIYTEAPIKSEKIDLCKDLSSHSEGNCHAPDALRILDLQRVFVIDGVNIYQIDVPMAELLQISPAGNTIRFRVEANKHGVPKNLFAVDGAGKEHKFTVLSHR